MELDLRADDVVGKVFYYGKGCELCNNTGYKGRQGLYEIMMLDDAMRDMIVQHASTQHAPPGVARSGACGPSASPASMAIYDGVTTIEEVVRETIVEE